MRNILKFFVVSVASFLDIYPKPMSEGNGLLLASFVPTHPIARVTIIKDSISIAMMDGDWLEKLSDQNQLDVAHERLDDDLVVLTAPTRELQSKKTCSHDSHQQMAPSV